MSMLLFCAAGFIFFMGLSGKEGEVLSASQEIKVLNNIPTVRLENVSISEGLAKFDVVNIGKEPMTAIVVHSGKFRLVVDTSYWDNLIASEEKRSLSLNIDGFLPLTIDAVIYRSGKADGVQEDVEKVKNTRKGFKLGLAKIHEATQASHTLISLKSLLSGVSLSEEMFESKSHYHGANDARNHLLDRLSRIESLPDQDQRDIQLRSLKMWVEKNKAAK
jgi:hypothetical protein